MLEVHYQEAHGDLLLLGEVADYLGAQDDVAVFTRLYLVKSGDMVGYFLGLLFVCGEADCLLDCGWDSLHHLADLLGLHPSLALD